MQQMFIPSRQEALEAARRLKMQRSGNLEDTADADAPRRQNRTQEREASVIH